MLVQLVPPRATLLRQCHSRQLWSSSRRRWRTRISESSLTASTSQRRPPLRRTRMLRFSLWIFSWNTDASHVQNLIIRMGDSKHHSRSGWHWWERLLGYHNPLSEQWTLVDIILLNFNGLKVHYIRLYLMRRLALIKSEPTPKPWKITKCNTRSFRCP